MEMNMLLYCALPSGVPLAFVLAGEGTRSQAILHSTLGLIFLVRA